MLSGIRRFVGGRFRLRNRNETSYVNWENTEVVGWSRRSATVCRLGVPTQCTGELPLAWDAFHGRNEAGGFAAVEGYEVVARVRASATIVARPDGTLRHHLVRGTWMQLFGSDWGFRVPPAYVEGQTRVDHTPLVTLAHDATRSVSASTD